MPARQVEWSTLLAHRAVVERVALRSPFGVMAFHGGLEAGTLEIAVAAADRADASLYTVEQPAALRWHVPSAQVDPGSSPALRAFLDHVGAVVAVHGYGRIGRPLDVLVGGADRTLARRLGGALRALLPAASVIDDIAAIPPELRGLHSGNPVNASGGGAQLELPVGVRRDHGDLVARALADVARAVGSQPMVGAPRCGEGALPSAGRAARGAPWLTSQGPT